MTSLEIFTIVCRAISVLCVTGVVSGLILSEKHLAFEIVGTVSVFCAFVYGILRLIIFAAVGW